MADENGIVVKPAIVKQDGNTTEIEIHIENLAFAKQITETANAIISIKRRNTK